MESRDFDYQKEWEDYRKRRNVRYLAFLSCIFGLPLGMLYFKLIGLDIRNPLLQWFLIGAWVAVSLFYQIRFVAWKCPYCKEEFYTRRVWGSSSFWVDKCGNCGLPKYFGSDFYKDKISFFPKYKN